ncbi:MAG: DUF420 domain-containing protein [Candidatus Bipolaricaulia bacterium]
MNWESVLPALDAALIATSGVCLLVGFGFIKGGRVSWHKRFMLTAALLAVGFLIVYVIRWALYGSALFTGEGWIEAVYYVVLITHIIMAIAIIPMAIVTVRRAFRGDYARHKRIARWTFPSWLYVAITGWLVYWMLYHLPT